VFTEGQPDIAILRAINLTGFERLHERYCLSEPRLEICKRLLSIVVFRHFDTREPRNALSKIAAMLFSIWTNAGMEA
jgi:hypothetical protein